LAALRVFNSVRNQPFAAMRQTIVLTVLCGPFIIFGAVSAAAVVRDTRAGLASWDWPSVRGEVLVAKRRSKLRKFEYGYAVDGTAYKGSRVAFVRVPTRIRSTASTRLERR
jgi:hypothetical protein